ncbi:MAG TPA: M1 family metallopeptidase [Acidimicrobiia bacterium]
MSDNPYRLPRTVLPIRYDLTLSPDLAAATFSGHESITVEVTVPVTEIVLNAHQLTVERAELRGPQATLAGEVELIEKEQRARIKLDGEAAPGSWELYLEFTGILNDQLVGFYKSTYKDVDGVEQSIATTQFEATDARRAFPCWDEPDLKAVFCVSLIVDEDLLAVSNTPEANREPAGTGKVAVRFADTMKMSTYLVAFVVGPFEATEPVDADGVPIRIITPRGKLGLTGFAMDCALFAYRYLRDYYGIPYAGLKIDHVAIPDFAFGAMENLGCITYRETALLLDEATASLAELERVLDVIGHELAHMWFGDLVTMKWWNGIWLNEAFASFMEYKSTDAMRPEWKRWLAFGAAERPWAYRVDSLDSTRPVEFEVTSPEEANEMFDALTYGKGSSVLRMLEQFIGEEAFRNGVGAYLRRHAYANTVTADLWASLDAASDQPVGEIMDTWILQPGYPQLEVTSTSTGLKLTQRRYLTIPDESDQTIWHVPVQIRGATDKGPFKDRHLVVSPEATVAMAPAKFVVANAGGHGFYRVRYDTTLFNALVDRLRDLEDLERYVLVDDTWAFVESGELSAVDFLQLAAAYRDETEQAVWGAVLGGVAAISHHLVDDEHRPAFAAWVGDLVGPAFARLGWDAESGESDLTRRLRGQLIGTLGQLAEDPEVIARCRKMTEQIISDSRGLDPELVLASLFVTAAHGSETEYRRFFERYEVTSTPNEQQRWLIALAAFDDAALVTETVTASLDGRIRTQDSSWVIGAALQNRRHGGGAWRQLRQQWDRFERLPTLTHRRTIEGVPALSRPEVATEVAAFLAETSLPHAAKSIAQNLEKLRANVMLRARETKAVGDFLSG